MPVTVKWSQTRSTKPFFLCREPSLLRGTMILAGSLFLFTEVTLSQIQLLWACLYLWFLLRWESQIWQRGQIVLLLWDGFPSWKAGSQSPLVSSYLPFHLAVELTNGCFPQLRLTPVLCSITTDLLKSLAELRNLNVPEQGSKTTAPLGKFLGVQRVAFLRY